MVKCVDVAASSLVRCHKSILRDVICFVKLTTRRIIVAVAEAASFKCKGESTVCTHCCVGFSALVVIALKIPLKLKLSMTS
jgi:hypothetical protein